MDPFRAVLLSISGGLSRDELGQLLYLCEKLIPKWRMEEIVHPHELFGELEKLNLLNEDKKEFLGSLLYGIQRPDLKDELFGLPRDRTDSGGVVYLSQSCLREHYQNVIGILQPLSWNDDFTIHINSIYTNLQFVSQTQEGKSVKRTTLDSHEEIFQSRKECGKPRRILVEGKAGMGKSTFAAKLAFDWANGNLESLRKFSLMLLLEAKQLKGDLKDDIFNQVFPQDFQHNPDKLYGQITAHQEDVLILVDGFDEVDPDSEAMKCLQDLFAGRMLRNACVIFTSRPGKASRIHRFLDTRVEITGFTADNVRHFVRRYFQDDESTAQTMISELEQHPVADDMSKVPLMALLLCALWEELPGTAMQSTMTGLFKEITVLLVKRHLSKQRHHEQAEELTDLEDIPVDLLQSLLNLGEVALHGLLDDELIFDTKQLQSKCLNPEVLDLGFLSRETSPSRLKPVQKCRFLHKSYQEFLAAFWLCRLIQEGEDDPECFNQAFEYIKQCFEVDLFYVFSFTAGLLGKYVKPFFEGLLSFICEQEQKETIDEALKEDLFQICVMVVFESQQPQLCFMLDSFVPDGCIVCKCRNVTPYGVRAMIYFIQSYPSIHCFQLEQSDMIDSTVGLFSKMLQKTRNLTELILSQNAIRDSGVKCFSENLRTNLPLTKFTFNANGTGEEGGRSFAKILKFCPHLIELDFSFNTVGDGPMTAIAESLRHTSKLEVLSLQCNKMGEDGAKAIARALEYLPSLTSLNLRRNIEIGVEGTIALAQQFRHVPQLTNLALGITWCGDKGLAEIANGLQSLPRLTDMELNNNYISHEGVTALLYGLQRTLKLHRLNLSSNKLKDGGAMSLAKGLPKLLLLKELTLDKNSISCVGMKDLAVGLKSAISLSKLNLAINKIGSRGAIALAEALKFTPYMKFLNLSHNNIGNEGFKALAKSFQFLHHLDIISIKANELEEESLIAIVQNLQHLVKLEYLHLGCTDFQKRKSCQMPLINPADLRAFGSFGSLSSLSESEESMEVMTSPSSKTVVDSIIKSHRKFSSEVLHAIISAAQTHPNIKAIFICETAIPTSFSIDGIKGIKTCGHF